LIFEIFEIKKVGAILDSWWLFSSMLSLQIQKMFHHAPTFE